MSRSRVRRAGERLLLAGVVATALVEAGRLLRTRSALRQRSALLRASAEELRCEREESARQRERAEHAEQHFAAIIAEKERLKDVIRDLHRELRRTRVWGG